MSTKAVLSIDIDDVLAANAKGFVDFSNKRWGTHLTVDDYGEHWADVWQTNEDETAKRAIELHESGVIGSYNHFEEAREVLEKLHERFRIIAVTSRRKMIEKETRAWIEQYFAGLIDDIRFAGFYDIDSTMDIYTRRKMTKADILNEIHAVYHIDDQLKHCIGAAEVGVKAILFGNYKWNRSDKLPDGIERCDTWQAVSEYFVV